MTEFKTFCKRVSEFKLTELGLSEEDMKYVTMAYKNHSLLVINARKFLTEVGAKFTWYHRRDLIALRIKRVLKCEDKESKAREISKRIYKKIEEVGYIRDFSTGRNWRLFRLLTANAVAEARNAAKKAKEFGFQFRFNEEELSFLENESELNERQEQLASFYFHGCGVEPDMSTEQYESYDIEGRDSTAAEIIQKILSPRQRELVNWLFSPRLGEVKFYRALTEEENNLWLSAVCALIANAYNIEEALRPYLV